MTGSTLLFRVRTMDDETLLVGGLTTGLVSLAFLAFVLVPGLTVYPAAAFLAVVAYGWATRQEATAKSLLFLTTATTVVVLGLITVFLALTAVPAFREMGLSILLRTEAPFWRPASKLYSLVPMIWGTFVTTAIATLVAAPLGVAGAVFISEIAPSAVRQVVKPAVEVLAGVPSIVYGFLGLVVVTEYMVDAWSLTYFGSLFVTGLVVGVMALPTVVSVAEDAIDSVPGEMKDGALALGTTDWQTTKTVTLPAAFSGVSAAVLLGVGRAVGETMAATVLLGNVTRLPEPLYDVFGNTITLTSLIASQYGTASGLQVNALFAAGVVLFVVVMAISVGSQYIESRMRDRLGGEL